MLVLYLVRLVRPTARHSLAGKAWGCQRECFALSCLSPTALVLRALLQGKERAERDAVSMPHKMSYYRATHVLLILVLYQDTCQREQYSCQFYFCVRRFSHEVEVEVGSTAVEIDDDCC